ncbi:MAG: alpha/beta hydrolase [Alphaproteobacteria bacterium]|nr:alpha/beta hydrolase [Alphaproteobacteria bacterium]
MRVDIGGGLRLFFDIEGPKLVPEGPAMRERPTLLLLHGGPGFDHSHLRPEHSTLTDLCQLVFVDHRGNGRSDYGDPRHWNLAQWGDDLVSFCAALGIEKPIVLGVSFGGFVAQSLATRHPDFPAKLILSSTAGTMRLERSYAMFERLGGPNARAVAERFWTDAANPDVVQPYLDTCFPLYNPTPQSPDRTARSVRHTAVLAHFFGPGGEGHRFDFLAELRRVRCPTLVLAGELDPITPPSLSEEIVAALPAGLARYEPFKAAGHSVDLDDPVRAFAIIRDFIRS